MRSKFAPTIQPPGKRDIKANIAPNSPVWIHRVSTHKIMTKKKVSENALNQDLTAVDFQEDVITQKAPSFKKSIRFSSVLSHNEGDKPDLSIKVSKCTGINYDFMYSTNKVDHSQQCVETENSKMEMLFPPQGH